MALTNLAVYGGAFCTPILVGKITATIGWHWTFYFEAIFCGACLPALVFFVPETAYRRSAYLNTDIASSEDLCLQPKNIDHGDQDTHVQNGESVSEHPPKTVQASTEAEKGTEEAIIPKKTSYIQSLKPFNGRKTDDSFWKLFLQPSLSLRILQFCGLA